MEKVIVIKQNDVKYPRLVEEMFPGEQYAEVNFFEGNSKKNEVFGMVRDAFTFMGLDRERYGSKDWNPLSDNIIAKGNTVLIKPNLVCDRNPSGYGLDCLVTHPSIVFAVIFYVWKAMEYEGKIIVADAPIQACNFDNLIKISGYLEVVNYYKSKGVNIELKDLRGLKSVYDNGVYKQKISDVKGIVVDITKDSEHNYLSHKELLNERITCYAPEELNKHHNEKKHEYLIAEDVLAADVIINIPKPKSHRIAGVTIGMKNFVGINVRKEYLPHHRVGDSMNGGDEYEKPSLLMKWSSIIIDKRNEEMAHEHYKKSRLLFFISKGFEYMHKYIHFKSPHYAYGCWHGNDTLWRTIVDLNKIVLFADKGGKIKDTEQRKIINIADMIVVGEGEGPLKPTPKYGGMLVLAENIVIFDEVIATLLGFDIKKIPLYRNVRNRKENLCLTGGVTSMILSNNELLNERKIEELSAKESLKISPANGYKGFIELED